jgi:hypothetical protein
MKKQNIAVLAGTSALALAMTSRLEARFPNANVIVIDKISDRPVGAEVASLGIPSYIPGTEKVTVHNFGSKIKQNATPQERSHQWEVLRNRDSSEEEVAQELGDFRTVQIMNENELQQIKLDFSDVRVAVALAESEVEKNEGYKKAYDMLCGLLA